MTPVILPQYGNSVESCILLSWKKAVGDAVRAGDVLAEVETDKAVLEVESPADGVITALLANVGDDVPVQTVIAHIGAAGEAVAQPVQPAIAESSQGGSSPRARGMAAAAGIDVAALRGTGPGGRVIARDVQAALTVRQDTTPAAPRMTPVARAMVASGDYRAPEQGSGRGGRITRRDLTPAEAAPVDVPNAAPPEGAESVRLTPTRARIAARMRESLANSAQLTLHARVDARALRRYRAALKAAPPELGLNGVTINDLVLFATARTLTAFPDVNAHLHGESLTRFASVHLGFAVDTPRGLLVPVIRDAQALTLRGLAEQAKTLAEAAQSGKLSPDAMQGGTFTVSNLGGLGIEWFTPILNPPQVAILGVGGITPHPVEGEDGAVTFVPHIALSLTIDHQVVDGAPGARFLSALGRALTAIDLLPAGG
jgi:pyruvate dehydrogenase E2 component (dihydrolipoamide acetyltransferase)